MTARNNSPSLPQQQQQQQPQHSYIIVASNGAGFNSNPNNVMNPPPTYSVLNKPQQIPFDGYLVDSNTNYSYTGGNGGGYPVVSQGQGQGQGGWYQGGNFYGVAATTNSLKQISRSPLVVAILLAVVATGLTVAATVLPNLFSFYYSLQPFGTITEETGLFQSRVCQQQQCMVYGGDLCSMLENKMGIVGGGSTTFPTAECGELSVIRVLLII
ncbi:hypothetical protein HDU79_004119, partial [Rhizoclosmatium sp. JEL0117]